MKLYLVSGSVNIHKNTGFIISSHATYADAFDAAKVGQYIHTVDVQGCDVLVSAGKIAKKV